MTQPRFALSQILTIRAEWDAGTCNVRAWANACNCSLETVRRIGRRDTHRNVTGEMAVHATGYNKPAIALDTAQDPTHDELAASFARLTQALHQADPDAVKRAQANALVDELRAGNARQSSAPIDIPLVASDQGSPVQRLPTGTPMFELPDDELAGPGV